MRSGRPLSLNYALLPFLLLLFASGYAQDYLEFKQIIAGSYQAPGSKPENGILPKHVNLTTMGGNLEARIKFKQAGNNYCHAVYRFEWKFSEPIDRLYKDKTINVEYRVTMVEGPCQGDQGKMIVTNASGFSPEFRKTGIRPRPGITVSEGKWISTGDASYATTAQISVFNTAGPATLKLNFESVGLIGSSRLHYEVVYLFE